MLWGENAMSETTATLTATGKWWKRLGTSTALVAGLTLLSTGTGFVREVFTGRTFGATAETDAFFAAFALISFLFFLFSGGAIQGAIMPSYQGRVERGELPAAAGLLRWSGLLVLLASLVLAVGLFLLAEGMVGVVYGGFDAATAAKTALATRILCPVIVLAAVGNFAQTVLHSKQSFLSPAIVPVLTNLTVIACLALAGSTLGVQALSLGHLLGNLPWVLLLVPLIVPYLSGRVASQQQDRRAVATAFMFLSSLVVFDQLSGVVQRSLLSDFEPGLISAFTYGTRLAGIPVGILAGALTIVMFPRLVSATASTDRFERPAVAQMGIVAIIALIVPASAFMAIEATTIVNLLFGRGAFTPEATANTAAVLRVYSISLPAQALIVYLSKAFVAARRNRALLVISILAGGSQLLLTYLMVMLWGWQGVPVATLIYAYIHTTLLLAWLTRFCHLDGRSIARSLAIVLLAAAVGAGAWYVPVGMDALAELVLHGGAFGLIYLGILYALGERTLLALFRA